MFETTEKEQLIKKEERQFDKMANKVERRDSLFRNLLKLPTPPPKKSEMPPMLWKLGNWIRLKVKVKYDQLEPAEKKKQLGMKLKAIGLPPPKK